MLHAILTDYLSGAGHIDPVLPSHGAPGPLIHQQQCAEMDQRQIAGPFALDEVDGN